MSKKLVISLALAVAFLFVTNVRADSVAHWGDWVTVTQSDGRTYLGNIAQGNVHNHWDGYIVEARPAQWGLTENFSGGANHQNFVFEFANVLNGDQAWASIYSYHPGSFSFDNGRVSYTTTNTGVSMSFGLDLTGNLSADATQSMLWQLARAEEMRPFGGGSGALTNSANTMLGNTLGGNQGGAMIDSFFIEMTVGIIPGMGPGATNPTQHIGMLAMDSAGNVHFLSQALRGVGNTELFFGFVADEGLYFTEVLWFTTNANGQINMAPSDFAWGDVYRNNIGSVHWESIRIGFGDGTTVVIPEPATIAILGLGLIGLGVARARRKR